MGMSFEAVRGRASTGLITLTGMERLMNAIKEAGIRLHLKRMRTWPKLCGRSKIRASLYTALTSNDGWWIRPGEAAELGRKLPKVAHKSSDPRFIRDVARFCRHASKKRGFFVW